MPLDRSAALLFTIINYILQLHWHPQIWLAIWLELDLAGFPKSGRIPDFLEPELKSGKPLL